MMAFAMHNNVIILCASSPDAIAEIALHLRSMGDVTAIATGIWHLSTRHSAADVADSTWPMMAVTDLLMVVDASNDDAAWFGLDAQVDAALQGAWRPGQ